ncbi:MAG: glycosyltransferase [Verrucomicrobiota bacterium JB022]|nr:glycosyltransferase [Verrucomicrobiota bacterium JB022]
MQPPPVLSLAVPMYNEEEGLDLFFNRVREVMASLGVTYEIVCVNDGSRDGTLEGLLARQAQIPELVVVDLSRNFGKDVALTAAIDHCTGRAVVPLDADLQDPPELLGEMLERWREGYDVVCAVRSSRKSDGWLKQFSARQFYRWFNRVAEVPIPSDAGDFRLMDRRVVEALSGLRERNRFMKGLFAWTGFKTAYVTFERPERAAGTTKWNYWKLWNFALDGIFAFSSAPLRIWTYLGVLISLSSFLYALVIVVRTLFIGIDVPGYASLLVFMLFLSGIQLIGLGVMGEYVGRIYKEAKQRPLYLTQSVYRHASGQGETAVR